MRTSFDWDGRAHSLEDQLLGVFSPDGDMGLDSQTVVNRLRSSNDLATHFRRVFRRAPAFADVRTAIVAYLRSLSAGTTRFERFYLTGDDSAITPAELRGWVLFRDAKAGCAGCHVPLPDPGGSQRLVLMDNSVHNLGIGYSDAGYADSGRFEITKDTRDIGAFRTPSLRNVALTPPYMHDGSLETLESVVEFYSNGGRVNDHLDPIMVARNLAASERRDIVAFLRSLTTEGLANTAHGAGVVAGGSNHSSQGAARPDSLRQR